MKQEIGEAFDPKSNFSYYDPNDGFQRLGCSDERAVCLTKEIVVFLIAVYRLIGPCRSRLVSRPASPDMEGQHVLVRTMLQLWLNQLSMIVRVPRYQLQLLAFVRQLFNIFEATDRRTI